MDIEVCMYVPGCHITYIRVGTTIQKGCMYGTEDVGFS